jgi:coenzyme F420-dependent glucose-6-phosphate dehydrogenase
MNEAPLGVAWPEPGTVRAAQGGRRADQVALAQDRVDFDGTYYQVAKATIYDRPDTPVPLYIAGSGPAATRLAGRRADGFITTSGKDPALYTETLLPAVCEGAALAGRSVTELEMQIEVKVSFDEDADRALADTHFWRALALTPEEKTGVEDPIEMQRLADQLPVERAASRFIVGSDPEAHVEAVLRYVEWGFTHLVFHAPGPDQERFLRLYGKEVLPLLRARTA